MSNLHLNYRYSKFLVVCLAILPHLIYCQKIDLVHFSLVGNVSFPSATLKKAVDNNFGGVGVGVGSSILFNPTAKRKNSPVLIGLDFNYLTFGRDKIQATNTSPPYKTSYNFYSVCPQMRLMPFPEKIGFSPFLDAIIGLKIMNARTKVDKNILNSLNKDEDEVIQNATDSGLGYGVGVGFFNRKYGDEGKTTSKASFTVRVMYHWGGSIEYVKRGSLVIDNGTVSFEEGKTRLDMLVVQIGLHVF
jgi:hypothetical protein